MEKNSPTIEHMAAHEVIQMLLILPMSILFSAVAVNKLWNHATFKEGLLHSPILPAWSVPFLAVGVPMVLLIVAGTLIIGIWYRRWMATGLWAYLLVMIAFTVYIRLMLSLPISQLPCTCLGIYDRWMLSWQQHLWLNVTILVYTAITLLTFYAQRIKYLLQQMERKPAAP